MYEEYTEISVNQNDKIRVFLYTDKYEYMFVNGHMYIRTKINDNCDEHFDYTDIKEVIDVERQKRN